MSADAAPRPDTLDGSILTPVVRRLFGRDDVAVIDWQVSSLAGGFAGDTVGGEGTVRVQGTADVGPETLDWSVVLKTLSRAPDVGSEDPRDWHYWKREALAYESGLLDDIEGGLSAPRCYGVTGFGETTYWLWLEDESDAFGGSWPLLHYAIAARHLGQFNGYAFGRSVPNYPWLTRGRAKNWIGLADIYLRDLPAIMAQEPRYDWLTETHAKGILSLWKDRRPLFDALDRLPRTLCHHDAFGRNLFARKNSDGSQETIAIDWQIVGTGAFGEDIVPLICVSLQFMDVPMGDAAMLQGLVLEGYLDGLRDTGCRFDERDVRFAFSATAALMLGVGGLIWLQHFLDAEQRVMVERNIGQPLDAITENFAALQTYLLSLGDEAKRLMR
ncbi:MAG: hypothetical protein GY798_24145 [Hyphomicrobiales bacterium]|nr:hypothetical protein [Hyphomicrobiales bacterium]